MLEALAAALPVICLDAGGPGAIVTSECGVVVRSHEANEGKVIHELAQAMIRLATDDGLRKRLSAHGPVRAGELTWDRAVAAVYSRIERRESAD